MTTNPETSIALATLRVFLNDIRCRHMRTNWVWEECHTITQGDWQMNVMMKALVEWQVVTKKLYEEKGDFFRADPYWRDGKSFDVEHKELLVQSALTKLGSPRSLIIFHNRLSEEEVYLHGLLSCLRDWMADWKEKNPEAASLLSRCSFWKEWDGMFHQTCVLLALRRCTESVERVLSSCQVPKTVLDVPALTSPNAWKAWIEKQDVRLQSEKIEN